MYDSSFNTSTSPSSPYHPQIPMSAVPACAEVSTGLLSLACGHITMLPSKYMQVLGSEYAQDVNVASGTDAVILEQSHTLSYDVCTL